MKINIKVVKPQKSKFLEIQNLKFLLRGFSLFKKKN